MPKTRSIEVRPRLQPRLVMEGLALAGLLLCQFAPAGVAAQPIAFEAESFTADVIYEKVPSGVRTYITGAQDEDTTPSQTPELVTGGDDRTWAETGLAVNGSVVNGFPLNGVMALGDTMWQLQPPTQNNALHLWNSGSGTPKSGTMTIAPQARVAYHSLDILLTAAPEHATFGVVLHFTDGQSVSLGNTYLQLQWGAGGNDVVGTFDRVSTVISYPSPFPASFVAGSDDGTFAGSGFHVYHRSFDLAALGLNNKPLESITLTNYSASNLTIFAVSGDPASVLASRAMLTAERVGSGIELRWDRGVLQTAVEVSGPWEDIVTDSPYVTGTSEPQRFFRVRY